MSIQVVLLCCTVQVIRCEVMRDLAPVDEHQAVFLSYREFEFARAQNDGSRHGIVSTRTRLRPVEDEHLSMSSSESLMSRASTHCIRKPLSYGCPRLNTHDESTEDTKVCDFRPYCTLITRDLT